MVPIRLIFAIHNHQPVGNFDGVFEQSFREAYAPFLELAREYPEFRFALHTSGPLLEWLVRHRPEYIDALRAGVDRGQVEILGGAFYEPILPNIPRRDQVGQIRAYTGYLERLFGQTIRGMWLPERVWEQPLASAIAEAGIEFTVLDDFHFERSGVDAGTLHGFFLTEDEGRLVKVFPNSERLRYLTPWQEPHQAYLYLRQLALQSPGAVVVCADDGEKFGGWPQTHDHVYRDGWMRRFLDMLRANRDWIETTTFARAVDETLPRGKVYLCDSSYREMVEWSLPPERGRAFRAAADAHGSELSAFLSPGGTWRNFRSRYAESDEMYCRMLGLSHRLARVEREGGAAPKALAAARDHLYRAQCNCPYWHGTFGGLYLPHLRNAIYEHLITAHESLDRAEGIEGPRVSVEAGDFNLDARQEVYLENESLIAWIAPARGAHLYELDIRGAGVNLLATLDRRPEAYHSLIQEPASALAGTSEPIRFKQAGLDRMLTYDRWPRKAFVDHVVSTETTLDDWACNRDIELGDFAAGAYLGSVEQSGDSVRVVLERGGIAAGHRMKVRKTISLRAGDSSLRVNYRIEGLPAEPLRWAVEVNIAAMAGGAPDRFYRDDRGRRVGMLSDCLDLAKADGLTLCDSWRRLEARLGWSQPAGVWAFPIETVSQSEGGLEAVYQSSAVVPYWVIGGTGADSWEVELVLECLTATAADAGVEPLRAALRES